MAITWYTSAGTPSDSTGADGDLNWDTQNRCTWGPKGKVTAGSWTGTAYSNIGPSGPALLSGTGAPSSSLGQNGSGYCDLLAGATYQKSNGAWTQVGSIAGAAGVPGAAVLGSSAGTYGPLPCATNLSLTSTPQTMPIAGTTTPCVYQPVFGSSFLGCSVQTAASGTTTCTLYDQTASAAVYTITCGANTYALSGSSLFSVTQYPLVTGHQYVWQISNSTSQTGGAVIYPIYATPSGGASAVSMFPMLGYATSTSITSTVVTLPPIGGTTGFYYYPLRTAGIYAIVATLTATGSTATTATANLIGYYQPVGGGSSSAFAGLPVTLTANGQPQTAYGPSTDTSGFASGYRFYFQTSASTAITATLQVQIYGYV